MRECEWCGRPHSNPGRYCNPRCYRWSLSHEPVAEDIKDFDDDLKELLWEIMHGPYFEGKRVRNPRDFVATCLVIASRLLHYPLTARDVMHIGKVRFKYLRLFNERIVAQPDDYAEFARKLCILKGYEDVSDEVYRILKSSALNPTGSMRAVTASLVSMIYRARGKPIPKRRIARSFGTSTVSIRKWMKRFEPYSVSVN